MMNFLGIVLTGLVVGLLARAIKPGDDRLGWLMTILLGIAGSFVATYVGVAMNWYEQGETAGWIASIVGAMALLLLYNLLRRKP
ncbi:MAG: GlsB/YeaQ/YmgE family stress response membrane protein [Comamonadaceae bacterium]|nr:GlsB/YeaQ/YmgE family stress response membrane protein [Pseudomonadota bacterium]MBS0611122.1 GlsB/YeaQ/YmgE family stress response membrane protein [Pseudomonadota bacterium]MDE2414992.1 GlsB/YeaQ/YmgE family stress response membrane protein [Comamonadaceae bacterium]